MYRQIEQMTQSDATLHLYKAPVTITGYSEDGPNLLKKQNKKPQLSHVIL